MKIHTLLFLFTISFGFSQTDKISFSYDSAGNQVLRDHLCLNCRKYSTEKTVLHSTVIAETPKIIEKSIITAYPNPVTDLLHIEWSPTGKIVDQIMLFSFDNKQLYHKKVNPRSTYGLELNFSKYPSGSYVILAIYSDNSKQSFKVIKK
jgi:hypothetical protein